MFLKTDDLIFTHRGDGTYAIFPREDKAAISGQTTIGRYSLATEMGIDLLLRSRPNRIKRVGSYPSSIFAEAASIQARINLFGVEDEFIVEGVDNRPEFVAHAHNGMLFPSGMLQNTPEWLSRSFNTTIHPNWVVPVDEIKERIEILPPHDLKHFKSDGPVDLMFINNLFFHLSDEDTLEILANLLPQSNGLVCIGGDFHWDEEKSPIAPRNIRDVFRDHGFVFAFGAGNEIIRAGDQSEFERHLGSDSFIAIHPKLAAEMR